MLGQLAWLGKAFAAAATKTKPERASVGIVKGKKLALEERKRECVYVEVIVERRGVLTYRERDCCTLATETKVRCVEEGSLERERREGESV